VRNFIILSILFSGILLSCNGKKSREKLLNHIDTLSYLSEVLNDSIGVKFATNQVKSYSVYMETNDYGKSLFKQRDELSSKLIKLENEGRTLFEKYGYYNVEYRMKSETAEATANVLERLKIELKSQKVFSSLVSQISIEVIGNDAYQYNLTFDKDLNLIGLVKNFR